MKFIRLLMTLGIVLFLSTVFVGCGKEKEEKEENSFFSNSDGTSTHPYVVPLDNIIQGKIGFYDSFYMIHIPESGVYTIEVMNLSEENNLDIDIYDNIDTENSEKIAYSNSLSKQGESLTSFFDVAGNYYFVVKHFSYTQLTYNLIVSSSEKPNEGSVEAPITVDLNTTYDGKVGVTSEGLGSSYYKFTTKEAGSYLISESIIGLRAFLYSDDNYEEQIGRSGQKILEILAANTTYYLKVQETGEDKASAFELEIKKVEEKNEGTASSPLSVSLNESYETNVGANDSDFDESFYTFTTSESGIYTISRLNATSSAKLNIKLYKGENFTDYIGYSEDTTSTYVQLDAETTYFLNVINEDNAFDVTYDLLIKKGF